MDQDSEAKYMTPPTTMDRLENDIPDTVYISASRSNSRPNWGGDSARILRVKNKVFRQD